MRKFILLISFCLIGYVQMNAQITITANDLPAVNDEIRYSVGSGSINLNATGADLTWDFSKLKATNQELIKFSAPLQTPYLLQFLTNSTFGYPETGLPVPAGFIDNPYTFIRKTNSAYVITGRGATAQNLPLGLVYSPKDTLYSLPLTYGKEFGGNFSGTAGLASFGSISQNGVRINTVDAWGSLTTPFGTFDCLRVKSVIEETDSIVFGPTQLPIQNNRTEYRWLAKGQKIPILEVIVPSNPLVGGTTIRFKDIYRPEVFVNHANFTASNRNVVVGDTCFLINRSVATPESFNWEVFPKTAKYAFVGGTSASSAAPKIIFSELGAYDIKLTTQYSAGSDDTLKTGFINVIATGLYDFTGISNLQIYPNPTTDFLNISGEFGKLTTIQLVDLQGKLLMESSIETPENQFNVDLNGVQKGIYFIHIQSNGKRDIKKVILN
ncbi:MAG: T9SS type A sorting domain-containing protein [Bacteroidia bacterium]